MRPALDEFKNPSCLKCNSPMRLTSVEDEYPGYQRRMFECPACGGTVTEWTGRFINQPFASFANTRVSKRFCDVANLFQPNKTVTQCRKS